MTPTAILTPVVLGLAFVGYVTCFRRRFWLTFLATVGLGALVLWLNPFAPEQALNWLGAAVIIAVAAITARLPPQTEAPKPKKKPIKGQKEIAIDGTNVIYWDGNTPALETLITVVEALKRKGFNPYVFLDASSRHHLGDKSLNEKKFAAAFGLHPKRVMVCPAGTEADAFILKFAKSQGLPIVSNDRFGDRAQQVKGIKLIKGLMANGKPIFDGF